MSKTTPCTEYACLSKQAYVMDGYQVVPLRTEDMAMIKQWRNEQMDALRQQAPLTDEQQQRYYRQTIQPSFAKKQPRQILFSVLENSVCIGYGGLVHINWLDRRGEFSFLLETSRHQDEDKYQAELKRFMVVMKQVAFDDLQFNRLHIEAYDFRPYVLAGVEQCGFKQEGRLREAIWMHDRFVDSLLYGFLRSDYDREKTHHE